MSKPKTLPNLIRYTVTNDDLIGFGISKGDALLFDTGIEPEIGDFTLVKTREGHLAIRLIGFDVLHNYIICRQFITYPVAEILIPKIKVMGKLIEILKGDKLNEYTH